MQLRAEGYKCTTQSLLDVLLGVAAGRSTIEAICNDLAHTPDPDTFSQ